MAQSPCMGSFEVVRVVSFLLRTHPVDSLDRLPALGYIICNVLRLSGKYIQKPEDQDQSIIDILTLNPRGREVRSKRDVARVRFIFV